jgi:hypothetical protein
MATVGWAGHHMGKGPAARPASTASGRRGSRSTTRVPAGQATAEGHLIDTQDAWRGDHEALGAPSLAEAPSDTCRDRSPAGMRHREEGLPPACSLLSVRGHQAPARDRRRGAGARLGHPSSSAERALTVAPATAPMAPPTVGDRLDSGHAGWRYHTLDKLLRCAWPPARGQFDPALARSDRAAKRQELDIGGREASVSSIVFIREPRPVRPCGVPLPLFTNKADEPFFNHR